MSDLVKQPIDKVKDEILLANKCVFSQQQFLGSKGAEALANEEVSGVVSNVYAAMEQYAKGFAKNLIYDAHYHFTGTGKYMSAEEFIKENNLL